VLVIFTFPVSIPCLDYVEILSPLMSKKIGSWIKILGSCLKYSFSKFLLKAVMPVLENANTDDVFYRLKHSSKDYLLWTGIF
jgi:hypothetical protein